MRVAGGMFVAAREAAPFENLEASRKEVRS
jgi:hypothetical protein